MCSICLCVKQSFNTMSQPTTRQELYDRIAATSKDEYVLSEMKRLGFWEKNADQPNVAEQIILRESELYKQYNALATERNRLNNQEAMLKEIRKNGWRNLCVNAPKRS